MKRLRSPNYPSLTLEKSIERCRALYKVALHHEVRFPQLAEAWGYSEKSSGPKQMAGALIQYGLLSDAGSGDARRLKLTDRAIRIVKDPDPNSDKKISAIQGAALAPKIFSEVWQHFGGDLSVEPVILTYLTLERREQGLAEFSDKAARDILQIMKANEKFAGLDSSVPPPPSQAESTDDIKHDLNVGDYVQWLSQGTLQFQAPCKVTRILEKDGFAFVEGTTTGIPIAELVRSEPPHNSTPDHSTKPNPINQSGTQHLAKTHITSSGLGDYTFDLLEGPVSLSIPKGLSQESYDDLCDWLDLIKRQIGRRLG